MECLHLRPISSADSGARYVWAQTPENADPACQIKLPADDKSTPASRPLN